VNILYLTGKGKKLYHTLHWPLTAEINKNKKVRLFEVVWPTPDDFRWCDVVYCNVVRFHMDKFKKVKKPKIAFIEDLWPPIMNPTKPKNRVSYMIDKHFDCLFVRYRTAWERGDWIKTWDRPWYWLPHCIDPKMFKDWKQNKVYDLLSVGNIRKVKKYALRHQFYQTFRDHKRFYRLDQGSALAQGFSKVINKAKITASDTSISRVYAKTMEIPGSMSLLASNLGVDMEDLGYLPDEHYLEYTKKNMKKKVLHYLDDNKERERITLNGYNLVHERHTIQQRAKEWFGYVESFLEGR